MNKFIYLNYNKKIYFVKNYFNLKILLKNLVLKIKKSKKFLNLVLYSLIIRKKEKIEVFLTLTMKLI